MPKPIKRAELVEALREVFERFGFEGATETAEDAADDALCMDNAPKVED